MSTYREQLADVAPVLAVEVKKTDAGDFVIVYIDSQASLVYGINVIADAIARRLKSSDGYGVAFTIIEVKPDTPIDRMKRHLEEVEGIIGVYTVPTAWQDVGDMKEPTEYKVVLNIDNETADVNLIMEYFKRIAILHKIPYKLTVDIVKYKRDTGSNLILPA